MPLLSPYGERDSSGYARYVRYSKSTLRLPVRPTSGICERVDHSSSSYRQNSSALQSGHSVVSELTFAPQCRHSMITVWPSPKSTRESRDPIRTVKPSTIDWLLTIMPRDGAHLSTAQPHDGRCRHRLLTYRIDSDNCNVPEYSENTAVYTC